MEFELSLEKDLEENKESSLKFECYLIRDIFSQQDNLIGKDVTIGGWIKSIRSMKNIAFISISDSSTPKVLQCILRVKTNEKILSEIGIGSAIKFFGTINKSKGSEQSIELSVKEVSFHSPIDGEMYPIQKKFHTTEFLRSLPHLRSQTATFAATMRIRNSISMATHKFFQEQGFLLMATPLITSLDCEGSGELFEVSNKDKLFDKKTYLTVSGQLQLESLAIGLNRVYTFSPTFRAENSNTTRHLSEFWMIESEAAFMDIYGLIKLAEEYLKFIIKYSIDHNLEDIEITSQDKESHIKSLKELSKSKFKIVDYTDAIKHLDDHSYEGPKVLWGDDIHSYAEKHLVGKIYKSPIILTNFPKTLKPFYMKRNNDDKTVAAMDVLLPKIGEVIGGSQREDDIKELLEGIKEKGLNIKDYQWYIDTRLFGNIEHSGFGLGLERLVSYIADVPNIRDTIPYPRHPGNIIC